MYVFPKKSSFIKTFVSWERFFFKVSLKKLIFVKNKIRIKIKIKIEDKINFFLISFIIKGLFCNIKYYEYITINMQKNLN